jgi:hypothetical protein
LSTAHSDDGEDEEEQMRTAVAARTAGREKQRVKEQMEKGERAPPRGSLRHWNWRNSARMRDLLAT